MTLFSIVEDLHREEGFSTGKDGGENIHVFSHLYIVYFYNLVYLYQIFVMEI